MPVKNSAKYGPDEEALKKRSIAIQKNNEEKAKKELKERYEEVKSQGD